MRFRKIDRALVGVLLSCGLLAACGTGDSADSSASGPSSSGGTIRLGILQGTQTSLLPYIASEHGFFETHGLDVQVSQINSGPALLAAMLGGDLDVFATTQALTTPAVNQGECVKYLTTHATNSVNLIGRSDVAWPNASKGFPESVRDLKGKTVGVVARGSAIETWLRIILAEAGLDPERDVTYVETGGVSTALPAFQQGTVDAQMAFPPLEQLLGQDGFTMIYKMAGVDNSPLGDLVNQGDAASCDWLASHEEDATAYCAAMWDAAEFVRDPANDAVNAGYVADYMNLEEAVALNVWQGLRPTVKSPPNYDQGAWDAQEKFLPPAFEGNYPGFGDSVFDPCKTDPRD